MKVCIALAVVLSLLLGLASLGLAEEEKLINIRSIQRRPINVLRYAEEVLPFGWETGLRVMRSNKLVFMLGRDMKAGLEVTLIEGFGFKKVHLVWGSAAEADGNSIKLNSSLWGLEYEVAPRFRLGLYWWDDGLYGGFSFNWRLEGDLSGFK